MGDERLRELSNLILFEVAAAGAGRDGNERREVVTRRAIASDVLPCIAAVARDSTAWPGHRLALKSAGVLVGTLDQQLAALKKSSAPPEDLDAMLMHLRALEAAREAQRRAHEDYLRQEAIRRSEEDRIARLEAQRASASELARIEAERQFHAAQAARQHHEQQAMYHAAQAQRESQQRALAASRRTNKLVGWGVVALGCASTAGSLAWCNAKLDAVERARATAPTVTTATSAQPPTSTSAGANTSARPQQVVRNLAATAPAPTASASARKQVILPR
ncbi:hypothetical protein [Sorangium cellulosum]|uniref:hypothetical protein n=1 Tax=Sorangium cellulosum TaxID=56 RepID=UPI0012FFB3EC|nr:hypothetical protein [Sorangium cellulosum]